MILPVTSPTASDTNEAASDAAAPAALVAAETASLASLLATDTTEVTTLPAADVADDTMLPMDEVTDEKALPAADVAEAMALPAEEVAEGTMPAAEYAADMMAFDWLPDSAPSSWLRSRSRPRRSKLYLVRTDVSTGELYMFRGTYVVGVLGCQSCSHGSSYPPTATL